ncbi:MAG: MmgE/PrpD family protein [Burkholderiales bacterium]
MSVTSELVERLIATEYAGIPAEAVEMAKQVCLDGIAVMIAGSREPLGVGRITLDYVRDLGGTPEASVVAGNFKTSALNAAYANGTLCHALDFDNTSVPVNHPTSASLPAILAIAEREKLSGRDVVVAIVLAFEVQGRMRLATRAIGANSIFHKPGVSGLMGAVTGAGKLLKLNAEQFCHAFGVAGSRAGSITVNTGTMTKSSHAGHGARMGVEAALLARRGWTAHPDVFGTGRFFETFYVEKPHEPELFLENFGAPYYMLEPGVGFKKYPSNYFTHRAIDAVLDLRAQHGLRAEDLERVEIDFPDFPHVARVPKTGLDGKFSVQYCTALALLDGKVSVESFSDARRFSADVEALLARTQVNLRRDISSDVNEMYTVVRVWTRDGRQFEARCDKPRGFPGVPLSRAERVAKFYDCVGAALPEADSRRLLDAIEALQDLADVTSIMRIASAAGAVTRP